MLPEVLLGVSVSLWLPLHKFVYEGRSVSVAASGARLVASLSCGGVSCVASSAYVRAGAVVGILTENSWAKSMFLGL